MLIQLRALREFRLRVITLLLTFVSSAFLAGAQITFTTVPAYGDSSTPLQGQVTGFSPASYNITVLIFVEGLGWYTKPFCTQTTLPIQGDGSWSTAIVTGGVDQTAIRIAAFVVPLEVTVPCTTAAGGLPSELFLDSVSHIVVSRPNPNARIIDFSGLK